MTKEKIYSRLLELEEEGTALIDLSHRGGHYGLHRDDFIEEFLPEIEVSYLPPKVGVYCNYLGGGIRGAVVGGGYNSSVNQEEAKVIDNYTEACKRRYTELEDGCGLNDEEDEDGETNWEAVATKASRGHGVESAY